MTGTGTQADPLQITNASELKEYCNFISGYGELINDIDLSELTEMINIEAGSYSRINLNLNGNNHKIRNFNREESFFRVYNGSWDNQAIISFKDIIFENIILKNNALFTIANSNFKGTTIGFYNCVLSSNIISNCKIINVDDIDSSTVTFNYCTVSSKSASKNHNVNLFTKCNFNNSHIHIEGNIHGVSQSSACNTTYITGNTTNDDATLMTDCTNFSNSYIAVTANGATAKIFDSTAPTVNGTSFVDKDIVTATGLSDDSPIKQLTTAQAKNADYLTSIGFLTIPESG